jgi:hypothetical protein
MTYAFNPAAAHVARNPSFPLFAMTLRSTWILVSPANGIGPDAICAVVGNHAVNDGRAYR